MRAIEKLPVDRYQSAEVMADQLEEFATSRTGLRSEVLVISAMEHAGLLQPSEAVGSPAPAQRRRASVRRSVAGLAVIGTLAVSGGVALQATAARNGEEAGARPLELMPGSPGYLRVMATPWAEVWVDGQRVDVTPFARAIPLSAGTHYVTFVHPNAPVEKRAITIARGEVRTLDVVMTIAERDGVDGGAQGPRAERGK
jgi:serine/threonine-protein kinase